jgi:hypothetical protein
MTTLVNGLLGGALAALLATAGASLVPRAATEGSQNTRGRTDPSRRIRWLPPLVGVLYGSTAGGLLVVLELSVLGLLAVPPTLAATLRVAVGWSALLFVLSVPGRSVLHGHLRGRLDLATLLVYHLVYGVGLGLWVRLTWIT